MLKKFWALTMALIMVTAALAGCGKKNSQSAQAATPATQQERQLSDVVMDLSIIASTDWSGREEEGKLMLDNLLTDDRKVIEAAKADSSAEGKVRYSTFLWAEEKARQATLTRKEKVAEGVADGIDTAEEYVERGKELLDGILNGSQNGGDSN